MRPLECSIAFACGLMHAQLCDAYEKVVERVHHWDQELTAHSIRMSERAMEEMRIQMDSYASAAGASMSVKESEFTRFVKNSRMEELYFQSIMEDCTEQLNSKGVAVIDVSKARDPTNPGIVTAAGWISKIIQAVSSINSSWSMYVKIIRTCTGGSDSPLHSHWLVNSDEGLCSSQYFVFCAATQHLSTWTSSTRSIQAVLADCNCSRQ